MPRTSRGVWSVSLGGAGAITLQIRERDGAVLVAVPGARRALVLDQAHAAVLVADLRDAVAVGGAGRDRQPMPPARPGAAVLPVADRPGGDRRLSFSTVWDVAVVLERYGFPILRRDRGDLERIRAGLARILYRHPGELDDGWPAGEDPGAGEAPGPDERP